MNAVLQCLCHIEKLVNYFKYDRFVIDVIQENIFKYSNHKNLLTSSFKYLIESLWPTIYEFAEKYASTENSNGNPSFSPIEFKNKISKMNPLFIGAQANDAKDLMNFIIMTLHEELNEFSAHDKNNNSKINDDNLPVDFSNKKTTLINFAKNFIKENNSKICDLFYGINGSYIKCLNCNIIKYNFQIYFFLNFPLEEVRKFKINNNMNNFMNNNCNNMNNNFNIINNNFNMNNMNFNNNFNSFFDFQNQKSVTIYECFDYYQKIERMDGMNQMYCNNCKNNFNFLNQSFITTGPEIFIILLNRGKGIQYDIKLEFYESLDLGNYIEEKETGYKYNLIGVVSHMGLSGASGHFVAFCKNPINENWYNYNDDMVTAISNINEQIINYAMPYILFYQKVK